MVVCYGVDRFEVQHDGRQHSTHDTLPQAQAVEDSLGKPDAALSPDLAAYRARRAWLAERLQWESKLQPGDAVRVRWGYGSGFRATGPARVVRVNSSSVRIELLELVAGLNGNWPRGQSFSVPRANSERWNEWLQVEPWRA